MPCLLRCAMQAFKCTAASPPGMYVATVTGRGMMHLPAELRERFGIKPGDKMELRATRYGIALERIPSLMEAFGRFKGVGETWARELLEEKRAELAKEEAE